MDQYKLEALDRKCQSLSQDNDSVIVLAAALAPLIPLHSHTPIPPPICLPLSRAGWWGAPVVGAKRNQLLIMTEHLAS